MVWNRRGGDEMPWSATTVWLRCLVPTAEWFAPWSGGGGMEAAPAAALREATGGSWQGLSGFAAAGRVPLLYAL